MQSLNSISKTLKEPSDLQPLIDQMKDSKVVLLGEASHGTSEYYNWRYEISKELIDKHGFNFIAVEGDWPDCYKVNQYIKAGGEEKDLKDVLKTFGRWPSWMWANEEVATLVKWLHKHNSTSIDEAKKVGFYGLDVYSLWDSLSVVLEYVSDNAPELLPAVYNAYSCFEPHNKNLQSYAYASSVLSQTCTDEVVQMLTTLIENKVKLQSQKGDGEQYFNAEQNALVVRNADEYYRTMLQGSAESWNLRGWHMMETLDRLIEKHGDGTKAIVWAHNTHVGDARATDMQASGMINIGQLAREKYGEGEVFALGFGSYKGKVIAAKAWDATMECMDLPPAINPSFESIMHEEVGQDSILFLQEAAKDSIAYNNIGHRAVGVVYNPDIEVGNYVPTVLAERYDAFIYQEETSCLHPYTYPPAPDRDIPETYPTGV